MYVNLEYANDTLLVFDHNHKKLWSIKAILRGFKLTSWLQVNFFKSSLIGVNMYYVFLSSARDLLNCDIDYIPFKHLYFLVGDNRQLETTWDPLVNLSKKRLNF